MPSEESKPIDPAVSEADAKLKDSMAAAQSQTATVESEDEDDAEDDEAADEAVDVKPAAAGEASSSKKKKKRSKRKKIKEALTGKPSDPDEDLKKAISGLTPQQMKELMALNPALASEMASGSGGGEPSPEQAAEMMRKLNIQEIMTGLAAGGKNAKDMGSYKFWQTQPVPKFGEDEKSAEEGPLKVQKVEDVPKEPSALVAGFDWVTVDLTSEEEMKEVYELLNGHYVEDDDSTFRFNYSPAILKWAMMPPGWQRQYHVGVRASQSRKLVAFISAIQVNLRVREKMVTCSEVNFLCVHKKLRGKRLTPVLIKEITRVSNTNAVWQGLYTAGIVLPRPVSTCRYYHRSINWQKLYECGFSPLPAGSKPQYQVRKYALPEQTSTKGLRELREDDLDSVVDLLKRYLGRFEMAPVFTKEEAHHWFIPKVSPGNEQVIWSYVVEDHDKKITDFFSFFCVESSVINNPKHDIVKVAYLFYYASETGLTTPFDKDGLKTRLNALMGDALILANRAKFDVFNALSLMDNGLFLEQQKFGAGDGQLHYYLFNYRVNPISGGVDKRNQLDERGLSGIGVVMP